MKMPHKAFMRLGFTVVELLVVISVIAIIAAIAIVSYSGIQNQARDASVKSDMDDIAGLLEGFRIQSEETNPERRFPSTTTDLASLNIKVLKNSFATSISRNLIYCVKTTGTDAYQQYTLVAQTITGTIYLLTEEGFQQHSLTPASLTSTFCTTVSQTFVSNGLSAPNTWSSWVGSK